MTTDRVLCACGLPASFLLSDPPLCHECERDARAAASTRAEGLALLAGLEPLMDDLLLRWGMAPSELRCRWEQVTPEILEFCRGSVGGLDGLVCGLPGEGFGLSGMPGVGKTGAVAALVRWWLSVRLERDLPRLGRGATKQSVLWLSWPATVNRLRVGSMRDGGLEEADALVAAAVDVPVLVLDDLGAERIRGSYIDDWAASQLDLVVDGRYRAERSILFTTSLSAGEFITRYGGRLFSRLVGPNGWFVLSDTLPDRRRTEAPACRS